MIALLSDVDHYAALAHSWHDDGRGYAQATIKGVRGQLLHRFVAARMGLDLKFRIDHEDLNRLNCQRENLRVATVAQNVANTNSKHSALGIKGVVRTPSGKYEARIGVNYKRIHLGTFDDAAEAQSAYLKAAIHYFGDFAR